MFRRGKTWYFTNPITKQKQSSGTTDKARAAQLLRDLENEAHDRKNGRYIGKWEEAAGRWMELNQHLASTRSQNEYHTFWLEHLKGMKLSAIDEHYVHDTIQRERPIDMKSPAPANSTANLYVSFVAKIIRFGKVTPPKFYRYPTPEGEREWLRPEQWPILRDRLPEDARRVCTFALATGLRIENVLRFEWSWAHDDSAFLPRDVTKTKQSYGIPLNKTALAVLEECRQAAVRSPTLAFIHQGQPWQYPTLLKTLKVTSVRAGLPRITPHNLRHTFAAWISMEGVSDTIRRRLGCWKLSMGADVRYLHFDVERLRRFVEMLDPLLSGEAVKMKQEAR